MPISDRLQSLKTECDRMVIIQIGSLRFFLHQSLEGITLQLYVDYYYQLVFKGSFKTISDEKQSKI